MTEPLFFDTDCLSAFLWINDQSLLAQLYPGRIVIPAQVYSELSNPAVPHLKEQIDSMIQKNDAWVESIQIDSKEFDLYTDLISTDNLAHAAIGRGEAAAIAFAKGRNGILASNNLKDVAFYVSEFHLQHKTTGDILKEALGKGLITEKEGNQLWKSMLSKRRKLGYATFTDFLKENENA